MREFIGRPESGGGSIVGSAWRMWINTMAKEELAFIRSSTVLWQMMDCQGLISWILGRLATGCPRPWGHSASDSCSRNF